MKTDLIQDLKEQRVYCLRNIEYFESEIEKYEINEGNYEINHRKKQIDLHEHCLAGYRAELFQIQSALSALSN